MYRIEMRDGMGMEENLMVLKGLRRETAQYVRDEFGPHVILNFPGKRAGKSTSRPKLKRRFIFRRLERFGNRGVMDQPSVSEPES